MLHFLLLASSCLAPLSAAAPDTSLADAFVAPTQIVITCPGVAKLFCGESTDPVNTGQASATTNCSTPATITYSDAPGPIPTCPAERFQATILRTWSAVDACGNQASCVQQIHVLRQIWELDILPGACPNLVSTQGQTGTISMAISGTVRQNVQDIVPGSLVAWLDKCASGPVSATSTSLGDVSTPYYLDSACGCHPAGADGIQDLKVEFSRQALVNGLHLDAIPSGSQVRIVVTGTTTSGCAFLAFDCVRVQSVPDCNGNGVADSVDIASGTSSDLDLDGVPDTCQGTQGCSHGYWKNHLSAWTATGFAPGDDFDTVFGVNAFTPDRTLLQALQAGGGGINNLGRQGVAALLGASHPGLDFPLTQAEVIAAVQTAVLNGTAGTVGAQLDVLVTLGCPLN